MERVVQFRIQGTPLMYSLKLTYGDDRVLTGERVLVKVELLEVRRKDRSIEFHMLNQSETSVFLEHYRSKLQNLPITPK